MRPVLQRAFLWLLAASSFLASGCLQAEDRNCTADERTAADKELRLNRKDSAAAVQLHLPWGVPTPLSASMTLLVLSQRDYVIGYDTALRVPLWTAHRLETGALGREDRVNCFRRDPRIDAPGATLTSDYDEPVFDQGHLSPNADMTSRLIPVINSFILSNMTPQFCQFNRGVWQILESLIRVWGRDRTPLYLLTGSVFDYDGDGKRDAADSVPRMKSRNGKTRVAVPSAFYKVVIHQKPDGTVDTLAFLMPNDRTDVAGQQALDYLAAHLTSLDAIETVAGFQLFSGAPRPLPGKADALWPIRGSVPPSLVRANCRRTADLVWR